MREEYWLKLQLIQDVVAARVSHLQAARQLGVSLRTVRNYCHRFVKHGPEGLKDRRTGNNRKLTATEEAAIVAFKRERPQRSTRLIRDRLHLRVSEEAVRLILAKHRLNGRAPSL